MASTAPRAVSALCVRSKPASSVKRTHFAVGGSKTGVKSRAGPPRRSVGVTRASSSSSDEPSLGLQIEQALLDAFPTSAVERVRDSLRFTLGDGEYKKNHLDLGEQIATSYIAGLTAKPYWDVHGGDFPWLTYLESNHEVIRDELKAALADPLLAQKGNAVWVSATEARDDAAGYGPDWRTLVLQDRCEWETTNIALFPKTVELITQANAPSVEVFFAKQAPSTGIKPHTDFTNFIMTAHLGLDVPSQKSWMKVGTETKYWENGVGMCADTSFVHSTSNESLTQDRYVLIVRFWHPELTKHEQNGVRFLFDAFGDLSDEGLAKAQGSARARTKTDETRDESGSGLCFKNPEDANPKEGSDSEPASREENSKQAHEKKPSGGRKKNKRDKRKASSSSGDALGLLAKGMK